MIAPANPIKFAIIFEGGKCGGYVGRSGDPDRYDTRGQAETAAATYRGVFPNDTTKVVPVDASLRIVESEVGV